MEIDILFVNSEPSFNEIAIVFVRYHEVVFRCKLVVGVNAQRDLYYYLLMPFITSKEKIKGNNKPTRINVVNWPNEKISKQFQDKAIEILKKKHPDLFIHVVEEIEECIEKRQKFIKAKNDRKPGPRVSIRTSRQNGAAKHAL